MTHVRQKIQYPSPYQMKVYLLTPQQTVSGCPAPNNEGFALPNQLFDSWKCSVNTRPTLWRTQSLLNISLFEWCESEGAVGPGAQRFGADGFLAHQRGRGGGEDFVLAAGRVIGRILTLLLQMRGEKKMFFKYQKLAWRKFNQKDGLSSNSLTLMEN